MFSPASTSSELKVIFALPQGPSQKSPLNQGFCEILMTKMENIEWFLLRHKHTTSDHLCQSLGNILLYWDISPSSFCPWARYRLLKAVLCFSYTHTSPDKAIISVLPPPHKWHKVFSWTPGKKKEGQETEVAKAIGFPDDRSIDLCFENSIEERWKL